MSSRGSSSLAASEDEECLPILVDPLHDRAQAPRHARRVCRRSGLGCRPLRHRTPAPRRRTRSRRRHPRGGGSLTHTVKLCRCWSCLLRSPGSWRLAAPAAPASGGEGESGGDEEEATDDSRSFNVKAPAANMRWCLRGVQEGSRWRRRDGRGDERGIGNDRTRRIRMTSNQF